MIGLGLVLGFSRGPSGPAVPTIQISASSVADSASNGSSVGTLTVSNGTGTYTFTEIATLNSSFAVASGGAVTTTGTLTAGTSTLNVQATNGVDTPITRAFPMTVTAADTTAPTLSAPTDTQTGATTATLTVDTNEGNGTLYWYISTSAVAPTAANLKAGTGAVASGTQAVSSTGTKTVNATGLTASTAYYSYFLHRDAAGNDSTIASADGFTTAAAASAFVAQMDATGQSNEQGGGSGDSVTGYGYGPGNSGGHTPMRTMVGTGSDTYGATTYAFEQLAYINTGQTIGGVLGPRGERKITTAGAFIGTGGVSALYGIAETVKAGNYLAGAQEAIYFGAAFAGQLVTDQMVAFAGTRWQGWRNAMKFGVRPYYKSMADAGIPIYRQFHGYSQIEAEISAGQNVVAAGLPPSTTYYAYYLHRSTGGTDSAVASAGDFTTSAASTSIVFPTITAELSGTIYWYVSTSATPPLATVLKMGTGANSFGNKNLFSDALDLLAWPARFHANRLHRASKFGHTAYMPLTQPIPVLTSSGGPAEAYTYYGINTIMPQVARWRVTVNDLDGNLGTWEDLAGQGSDQYRHDGTVILKHNFANASFDGVHFLMTQHLALGKARINAVKALTSTTQYHTQHPITRCAPVFLDTPTAGTTTGTTAPITVRCDEAATINVLAVAANSTAPSMAAVRAGLQLAHNSVNAQGDPQSQVLTVTGLTAGTTYDLYLLPEDPDGYGHYGHSMSVIEDVATLADTVPAQFNTTFKVATGGANSVTYSNNDRTVVRSGGSPTGNVAFKAVGEKTSGLWHSAVKFLGTNPSQWGLFVATLTNAGASSTPRISVASSGIKYHNGTTDTTLVSAATLGTIPAGTILQICEDHTAKQAWFAKNGTWYPNSPSGGAGFDMAAVVDASGGTLLAGIVGATDGAGFQLLTTADTADYPTPPSGFAARTTA